MDTVFIILLGLVLAGVGVLIWLLGSSKKKPADEQSLVLLQQQMQELSRTLDQKLTESQRHLHDASNTIHENVQRQLRESAQLMKEFTGSITKLEDTNKQVISFADQLKNLQDILKNPKQRGVLGEYFLETVLKNALPPESYKMQYRFEDGEIVDAVVFVKDRIVPIDSKFSLENYNRIVEEKNESERTRLGKQFENDLKLRVKETSKYIRPKEGTTEFAFMFIPHEAIYYDLLVNKIGSDENILERAMSEYRVLIVSPTSFLAYLQTVLQGLKMLQIEEQAEQIIKRVGELARHWGAYDVYMQKLGNNLSTTVNSFNAAHKELGKVDKDVLRITGAAAGIEPLVLDKPTREE